MHSVNRCRLALISDTQPTVEECVLRSHCKNTKIKCQDAVSPPKHTSPVSSVDNYLDESQDTECKRTIRNLAKNSMSLKRT